MGLFDFLSSADINAGVAEFRETAGAILLDVRTSEEYHAGHIGGSINLPLAQIALAEIIIKDKSTVLFVYCRSGNRSGQAADYLKKHGYTNVKNIGGIVSYRGKVVR